MKKFIHPKKNYAKKVKNDFILSINEDICNKPSIEQFMAILLGYKNILEREGYKNIYVSYWNDGEDIVLRGDKI